VLERDRRADAALVFAVSSTGIFCRPSCPSRRPRRDRVTFFPTAAAARAAGYRPCRRCRPEQPSAASPELASVRRACEAAARVVDRPWTVARLAHAAGTSIAQLQRAFRRHVGITPRDYVAAMRRRQLLQHLQKGATVTTATYDAGFGSISQVYEGTALPGMTPATYGKGGAGAAIEWQVADTAAGPMLVAATARGICFLEFGASPEALLAELRREFPRATIAAQPSPRLAALADAARALAEARPVSTELPLDIRGTAFQWRVWRELARIPIGETRTYAQIAAAIGQPAAVRAAARAIATNPVSVVIPCHRVVGTNGSLTGYRWGVDVKRALLDRERSARNQERASD
jgi:AraC family transcriptional regulator of adaptative response/methylated-DNA-[protein]-cysteine methyltransferase